MPLYRNHVFSQIKPATNTRVDFGYCFKGYKASCPGASFPPAAPKKATASPAIAIASPAEVDAEVKRWLKTAYDLDA